MPIKSKSKDIESKNVVAWGLGGKKGWLQRAMMSLNISVLMLDCGGSCTTPYIY